MTRLITSALTNTAALLLMAATANGTLVYTMDFSVPGQGATHTRNNSITAFSAPSPVAGSNWTLTYGSVSSDSTTNEFITNSGVMRVQDWGGEGTITSDPINIVETGTVDIVGSGLTIGPDGFNSGSEGITWFYTINSGTPVTTFLGHSTQNGAVDAGTDVGAAFNDVPVFGGDRLEIGFSVDVNGAGDGVEVSSMTVNFTAIPEPSGAVAMALVLALCVVRRRMQIAVA